MKKYSSPELVVYGDVRTMTAAVGSENVDDSIFIDGVALPDSQQPPGFQTGSENLCDTQSEGEGACD